MDQEFVFYLQAKFFFDKANGISERMLSAQNLLQLESAHIIYKDVSEWLFSIADDSKLDDNTRATAADIILREGSEPDKIKARKIITALGGAEEKKSSVFDNSQNVHSTAISDSVNKYIEKLVVRDVKLKSIADVMSEIMDVVKSKVPVGSKRFAATNALNRIKIDTARFSSFKATPAEILCHIWERIQSYDDKVQSTLETRLTEELIEMSETCSSGYAARLLNVLSGVEVQLKIGWADQIIANAKGRMNAAIRDCKDDKSREILALGTVDDSLKAEYNALIKRLLDPIKQQLLSEFVTDGGYISTNEFNTHWERVEQDWS
jgi:hypothetical protein